MDDRNDRPLPRDKKLKAFSSQLRKHATKEENHLWYDCLRAYPVRFNRQRIIGKYIADFYCAKAKLVIELDGSTHYEKTGMAYDEARNEYMESLGLKVMRFSNLDIVRNFQGVCGAIDIEVKNRIKRLLGEGAVGEAD